MNKKAFPLTTRLRVIAHESVKYLKDLLNEAADEIERLQKENQFATLRERARWQTVLDAAGIETVVTDEGVTWTKKEPT